MMGQNFEAVEDSFSFTSKLVFVKVWVTEAEVFVVASASSSEPLTSIIPSIPRQD
jgi:hypothetical protein